MVAIPMAILTMKPHLSPRLTVHSSRVVVHSSMWLLRLGRSFFRDIKRSAKWVFLVISLWNQQLFLGWSFCWLNEYSIFGIWFAHIGRLGKIDFCKGRSCRRSRLVTGFQTTTLTYLAIEFVTTNANTSKTNSRSTILLKLVIIIPNWCSPHDTRLKMV